MNAKQRTVALLAALGVVALAACGSGGDEADAPTAAPSTASAPTTAAPTTTDAPTTTEPAPTTTKPDCYQGETRGAFEEQQKCVGGEWVDAPIERPAPTTAAPAVPDGMIWRPDPATVTWNVDDITSRLVGVVWIDTTRDRGTLTDECRRSAKFHADYDHLPSVPTQCLYVEWSYDVGPNLPVNEYADEGYLTPGDLVTPEGKEIGSGLTDGSHPGTVDNPMSNTYVEGVPGSVLRFETGNNHAGWTEQVIDVPTADQFVVPFLH